MAYEDLIRTNYDHSGPHTAQDHHQDMQQYHLPFGRMQNSNLFHWGIVNGMNVTGTIGSTSLQVNPGVAMDAGGRLLSLATGGMANTGANPNATVPQHNVVPLPVTLSTDGFQNKTVHVTVQHSVFYSKSATDPYDPGDYAEYPWVRLQETGLFVNDGSAVILGTATIDASGHITLVHGNDRKYLETSLGKLKLRKPDGSTSAGAYDIKEKETVSIDGASGRLTAGGNGETGEVVLKRADGTNTVSLHGSTGNLTLGGQGADGDITIKSNQNKTTISLNGDAGDLNLGGGGANGDLRVKNSNGDTTIHVRSDWGNINLGGHGADGDIILKNSSGADKIHLDGDNGQIKVQKISPYGNALDIHARYVRIHGWDLMLDGRSGNNKRALVDNTNELVINWANDYSKGVRTPGDLRVFGALNAARHVQMWKWGFWAYAWNDSISHYLDMPHASRNDYDVHIFFFMNEFSFDESGTDEKAGKIKLHVTSEGTTSSRCRIYVKNAHGDVSIWALCVRK